MRENSCSGRHLFAVLGFGFALLICATNSIAQSGQDATNTIVLDEFVVTDTEVTATKRVTNLQDTAMSLAVVPGDLIEKRGLVGMEDYLRTTPGVAMQDRGAGQNAIVMRGIGADPQNDASSVGVYYGEIPITGAGGLRGGNPDIKLVDIDRIEILRGPQGTLFGEGSMSGTVRVIPNPPDLSEFSVKIAATYSSTADTGGDNSMIQGVLNLPIVKEKLAVRALFYNYDNSGYYENVAASDPVKSSSLGAMLGAGLVDRDNVGSDEYTGGRIAIEWLPRDSLSLNVSYFRQEIDQHGLPEGSRSLQDFQQARFETESGAESLEHNFEATNLELVSDHGSFSLLVTSSWMKSKSALNRDFGAFVVDVFGGDTPALLVDSADKEAFVAEGRITTKLDGPLQALLGIYYADSQARFNQFSSWGGLPEADPLGGLLRLDADTIVDSSEKAVFGELSYAFGDHFDATVGFRYFAWDTHDVFTGDGVVLGGPTTETVDFNDDQTTYKLNLSYSPDDARLYYVQVQQGYRAGRALGKLPVRCDLDSDGLVDGLGIPAPTSLDPDDLTSYEVGIKLALMDRRLQLRGAGVLHRLEGHAGGVDARLWLAHLCERRQVRE